jgi:prepilin-type N-terminal cleavage/methylation domain-containing protein
MQNRRKQGFTLIELLVVISIIALLLSILTPSLQRVKEKAREIACRSNLKQWGIIYMMYAQNFEESLPAGWNGGTMWMVDLLPYYGGTNDICLCPSATKFLSKTQDIWVAGEFTAWGIYGDGSYPTPYWGEEGQYGSYGVNDWCHNPSDEGLAHTYPIPEEDRPLYWRTMIDAKRPETIPLMGGCMWDGTGPTEYDIPPQVQGQQEDWSGMSVFCLDRHKGDKLYFVSSFEFFVYGSIFNIFLRGVIK